MEAAQYDEGLLMALPDTHIDPADNIDEEIRDYPFDENSYLDPQFLAILGALADRGLATEMLRLLQLQTHSRFLSQWELGVIEREKAVLVE